MEVIHGRYESNYGLTTRGRGRRDTGRQTENGIRVSPGETQRIVTISVSSI